MSYTVRMDGRTCTKCGEWKPAEGFYLKNGKPRERCKVCFNAEDAERRRRNPIPSRERARRWRDRNREAQRERERHSQRRRKYGVTRDDFETMMTRQDGRCAICRRPPGEKALAVDHCHADLKVRGLLCASCNNGLGRFGDDPEVLDRAAAYLRGSWG